MFSKNDIVVVIGSTRTKKERTKVTIEIGKVLEVGVHELIVLPSTGWSKRGYRISKKSCVKIPVSSMKTHVKKVIPSLGDLVLYYATDYTGEVTKKVGILIEHTDYPGKERGGIILCDGEAQEFPLRELMILDPESVTGDP